MLQQYKKMNFRKNKKYIKLKSITTIKEKFTFDIGLAVLRPILSFFVIFTHCYDHNSAYGKWKEIMIKANYFWFHVPTFFIISFYFTCKTLISSNYKKKFERLQRLFIPYFLWPIIVFLLNKLLLVYSIAKEDITFSKLKFQLLYGTGENGMGILWFQWNLIFITLLFILIIFIFKKNYNFILIIIIITAFIYQYNGKNKFYFSKKDVLGRILEMIPFAVIGFLISDSEIIIFLKKHRLKTVITCIYLLYFITNYEVINKVKVLDYNGIRLFIISICVFITFVMFPSEKIKNKIIIKIIKQITSYTAGIYYIHAKFSSYISNYIESIKNRTIKGCIIIYLLCYLISFLGILIFGKTKLRHLFI